MGINKLNISTKKIRDKIELLGYLFYYDTGLELNVDNQERYNYWLLEKKKEKEKEKSISERLYELYQDTI